MVKKISKAEETNESHEHNPQKEQEKLMRMAMMEQEARQIEQQLEILEHQIIEMQLLKLHMEELDKGSQKKEILANLGRNIFIEAESKNKDFLVDVGAKTIVRKNAKEVAELIEKELSQLEIGKHTILQELQRIAAQLN
jgi:prefoldin subunit 5